jgi:hypothetical protein
MKINGININELPEKLHEMAHAIDALLDVTDLGGNTPEIRYDSNLDAMRGVSGVFFEHHRGNIIGIYAGGTEITNIVSGTTWNICEEQAEQLFADDLRDQATAAARNIADIKNGK